LQSGVKFVGFIYAPGENRIKVRERLRDFIFGEVQAQLRGTARRNRQFVKRAGFGATAFWVHGG